jgi:hypothetical protein
VQIREVRHEIPDYAQESRDVLYWRLPADESNNWVSHRNSEFSLQAAGACIQAQAVEIDAVTDDFQA